MPTDYRGPMRNGLWWSTPDSWQVRYERHIDRLHRLQSACHDVDLLAQSCYRQWREFPLGSKQEKYYSRQYAKACSTRDMLQHEIAKERAEIKAIEDGYHEP